MAPVADKYLIFHSVCVKGLHETNVKTAWPFESGHNKIENPLEPLRLSSLGFYEYQ